MISRQLRVLFVDVKKILFFQVILSSNFLPKFRSLIFRKILFFQISGKWVGNNIYNVYIFWKGGSRAFQNRFDHVHTTFLDHSTLPQSCTCILRNRVWECVIACMIFCAYPPNLIFEKCVKSHTKYPCKCFLYISPKCKQKDGLVKGSALFTRVCMDVYKRLKSWLDIVWMRPIRRWKALSPYFSIPISLKWFT